MILLAVLPTRRFINFVDNSRLDGMGFAPFGEVVEGMDTVDRIYKIGEKPSQNQIQRNGTSDQQNVYLLSTAPL